MKNYIINCGGLLTIAIIAIILAAIVSAWQNGYRKGQLDAFNGQKLLHASTSTSNTITVTNTVITTYIINKPVLRVIE